MNMNKIGNEKGMKVKRTNEQGTELEMKEQAR